MSLLSGEELSKRVAELYKIDAINVSVFTETIATEKYRYSCDSYLHEDSAYCFELANEYGIHWHEFPYKGSINGKMVAMMSTSTLQPGCMGFVEVEIFNNDRNQAARTAILRSLIAIKEY